MVKVHTTLSVDSDVLQRVKETDMNMSDVLDKALKERLQIKTIEIKNGDKCNYCNVKMRQATKENMNGLYWYLPDEKWICPRCDKEKIRAIINSEF